MKLNEIRAAIKGSNPHSSYQNISVVRDGDDFVARVHLRSCRHIGQEMRSLFNRVCSVLPGATVQQPTRYEKSSNGYYVADVAEVRFSI